MTSAGVRERRNHADSRARRPDGSEHERSGRISRTGSCHGSARLWGVQVRGAEASPRNTISDRLSAKNSSSWTMTTGRGLPVQSRASPPLNGHSPNAGKSKNGHDRKQIEP